MTGVPGLFQRCAPVPFGEAFPCPALEIRQTFKFTAGSSRAKPCRNMDEGTSVLCCLDRLLGVLVNTATALSSESSSFDVLHQEWRRAVLVAQSSMQVFEDMQAGVEAHQVHQFKGAHRMVQPELQRLVDVAGRSNSLLQHVERFVADHRIDAAGDESRRLANDDHFLTHSTTD